MPTWGYLLIAFVWLLLFRARWKRRHARVNATITAGAVRDLGGRGGF